MRILIVLVMSFFIASCSCSDSLRFKSQFMRGCGSKIGSNQKEICGCTFDKIKENYGKENMKKISKGYIPNDFLEKMSDLSILCRKDFYSSGLKKKATRLFIDLSGSELSKSSARCVYDKLEEKYGKEELRAIFIANSLPKGYNKNAKDFIAACK